MNRKSLTTAAIVIGVLLATLALGNQPGIEIKSLPPQGLYDSCAPADAECQGHLDKMAGAGFKLIINYGVFGYDVADIVSYADHAHAVGMQVIWDVRDVDRDSIGDIVNAVKTHPATWGYYIADEPAYAQILSPNEGNVSGTIELTGYSWIHSDEAKFANIQFLLDGNPLLGTISKLPDDDQYSLSWDTTRFPDGPHLIQARVEDSRGITETSEPIYVTVNNGGAPAALAVTTASLPSAGVSASYSAIVSATGGTRPYHWRLSAGSLPGGLALDSGSGVISGIPRQAGQWRFTISVEDAGSSAVSKVFALDVSASSSEEQALVRNFSELVRSLDSVHPQLLVHFDAGGGDPLAGLREFADPADVIALDLYTLAANMDSETVATSTATLRSFADSNRKQWGFVLQSFDGEENYPGYGFTPGWPDVARMRAERDMVLADNPAFILWYSYFDILNSPDPAGHWADLVNAAFSPIPIRESTPTRPAETPSKNTVRSIRTVPSGVEIEVTSDKEFPVRNELAVLRIGAQEFTLSRYPESGNTDTLIFTLTTEEFAKTVTGDPMTVRYGRGGQPDEQWNFGPWDKSLLPASKSVPQADEQTSTPVFAAGIPAGLFGLHFFHSSNSWPTVSSPSYRLWDTGTAWAFINTAEGEYDWTQLDIFLDLARVHNVDLLYTFGLTPPWASLRPNEPCVNPPGRGCAAPPRDMRYWDDFVRAIAIHNKEQGGRIKYWELWNEWNAPEYWTGDTATMVAMAQHAYRIIKSIDSNALVLTLEATGDDNVIADYTNRFLAAGGGNYTDVITFHGYRHTPEEIDSLVNAIREVMVANGQSAKPLWDTEGSWGQDPTLPDLDEQAAFAARYYLLHWSKGVERFYWYGWDGYDESDPQNSWGTLWDPRRGGIQKPGIAYREVYQWLVGATMKSNCAVQSDSTTWICGLSRPGGYEAQAIWNTVGNVSIRAPSQFRQYRNLDGNRVAIQSGGSVTIGIKPILLETEAVVLTESTSSSSDFFPIGLWSVDDFYPRSPTDPPSKMTVLDELPQVAKAGFNLIQSYRFEIASPEWGNTDEDAQIFLDAAQKSGLKVLMGLSHADWVWGKLSNDQLNLILKRVRALKNHPALWGWVLNDDTPQGGFPNEGQGLLPDPAQLRRIKRAIKEVDAVHPLVVAVPGAVDQSYEYRDIADIYMPDNFPIGFEVIPPGLPQEWEMHPEDVGEFIDLIYKAISPNQKVLAHIQIYNLANDSIVWGAPDDPNHMPDNLGRYPTRAEMRFMAYNALIHKSQGVCFNGYFYNYKMYGRDDGEGSDDVSPRGNASHWKVIASVATELKSLAPILLAPDANKQITVKPETAGIEFLLKDYKNKLYFIAANPSVNGKTVTFTMSQPATAINVLSELRSITPKGVSFTDTFDAYEVHCYEISTAVGK